MTITTYDKTYRGPVEEIPDGTTIEELSDGVVKAVADVVKEGGTINFGLSNGSWVIIPARTIREIKHKRVGW